MSRIGPPPRGAISSKDVSNLQLGPGQCPRQLLQASFEGLILQIDQHLVWADGVFDRLGGHMGVLGRGR